MMRFQNTFESGGSKHFVVDMMPFANTILILTKIILINPK